MLGGIADGRGLVAALVLGAIGAWIGTAFVLTKEAGRESVELGYMRQWELDAWKKRLIETTEDDTMVSRVLSGKTLRLARNKCVESWERKGGPVLKTPFQSILTADLHEGMRQAHMTDFLCALGGQVSGMITQVKPAAQFLEEMMEEAMYLIQKLSGYATFND